MNPVTDRVGQTPPLRWVFRVAATPEVGGGHVMRCLSLALVVQRYVPVTMVVCPGGERWLSMLEGYGLSAEVYSSDKHMTWMTDNTGLLVDGYGFSQQQMQQWSNQVHCMAYVDDTDDVPEFIDLVIALGADGSMLPRTPDQTLLQGLQYAMLAPEYAAAKTPTIAAEVQEILISFGLRDSKNFVVKTLDLLAETGFSGRVNVAIGSTAPHLQSIQERIGKLPFHLRLILDAQGLHDLLMGCDMAIGAAGVSMLERMALGVPAITLVAADNQIGQARLAEQAGATYLISPTSMQSEMPDVIEQLLAEPQLRETISRNGMRAVDGLGTERVARCMVAGEC